MSFLIDPPWLYANGRLAARLPERVQAPVARATLGVFLATSVSLYLNRPWTEWIWRLAGADDGRDWMLNSGLLKLDHRTAGASTHAVSTALFASYPLWLWLGLRHGRR
jgi:hypothetical protein